MPVDFKDYYQTLGVKKDATADEIKKAFRALARVHHPDKAKPDDRPAAEAKFKEISEAYDVLGDAEKRTKYDQLGANWNQYGSAGPGQRGGYRRAGGGPQDYDFHFGGTGFSDFFEQFFSGGGGGFDPYGGAGRQRAPARGQDMEAEIMVPLNEAYSGAERTIRLERVNSQTGERQENSYKVRIPAGVKNGQRIRLSGQGERGASAVSGDLYLRVRLAAHPDYQVQDADLIYTLELPAWDAALGASKEIPLPDSKRVRITVPAGARTGSRVRLRGLGLPKKDGKGDIFVEYAVYAPDPQTDEVRQLWEKLRETAE
ncbi:DnaJ C-terminal domain-containing protein [Cerasicoccus arenae]|uniref:Molecular chaperone DnaJ n=1 Tax=Cerasicoccus arenae TaxID=424488 RepID=A0A8J3GFF0_9BACT|nr:DnaJ C-terminal domain-containing protein [Cerasicoccus arenae]MBK1857589.1 DnaJ domain-containing protein [Cerasicoccus arenae]GHC05729.1 molecular chaperone DnaJ [Cerasicoccus arenae]